MRKKCGQVSTSIFNLQSVDNCPFLLHVLDWGLLINTGNDWYRSVFAPNCVTASITHFVPFELGNLIETLSRLGFVATVWLWAAIAMLRMETVIYVTLEVGSAMKPGASANEDATGKPLRTVVAVGGAVVWSDIIITIRTFRCDSDVDVYLSLCFGSSYREADCSNSS